MSGQKEAHRAFMLAILEARCPSRIAKIPDAFFSRQATPCPLWAVNFRSALARAARRNLPRSPKACVDNAQMHQSNHQGCSG